MNEINLTELDVVFISYDEDNAEDNWSDLINKVPWAKRVHGVKGSDAAHKEAAKISETERFISIDGDNKIDETFFDQVINFNHEKVKDKVVSWSARNHVNGLVYGNGGIKCWPVDYALEMQTHEASKSDDHNQIDFCWDGRYTQMNNCYSTTYCNGSAKQAFRAGFREGVKMSLDQGEKVSPKLFKEKVWHGNYDRLLVWCTVGRDIQNGIWSIYGARLGCKMTTLTNWDHINVRDFDYINKLWDQERERFIGDEEICLVSGYSWSNTELLREMSLLKDELRSGIGLELCDFNEEQSEFFKKVHKPLPRMGSYMTDLDMENLRRINQ